MCLFLRHGNVVNLLYPVIQSLENVIKGSYNQLSRFKNKKAFAVVKDVTLLAMRQEKVLCKKQTVIVAYLAPDVFKKYGNDGNRMEHGVFHRSF